MNSIKKVSFCFLLSVGLFLQRELFSAHTANNEPDPNSYDLADILQRHVPLLKEIREKFEGLDFAFNKARHQKDSLLATAQKIPLVNHILQGIVQQKTPDIFSLERSKKLQYALLFAPDHIPNLLRELSEYIQVDLYDSIIDALEEVITIITKETKNKDGQPLIAAYVTESFEELIHYLESPVGNFQALKLEKMYTTLVSEKIRNKCSNTYNETASHVPALVRNIYLNILQKIFPADQALQDRYLARPWEFIFNQLCKQFTPEERVQISSVLQLLDIKTILHSDPETAKSHLIKIQEALDGTTLSASLIPFLAFKASFECAEPIIVEYVAPMISPFLPAGTSAQNTLNTFLLKPIKKLTEKQIVLYRTSTPQGPLNVQSNQKIPFTDFLLKIIGIVESFGTAAGIPVGQGFSIGTNLFLKDLSTILTFVTDLSKAQATFEKRCSEFYSESYTWKDSIEKLTGKTSEAFPSCIELYYRIKNGDLRSKDIIKRIHAEEFNESIDYEILIKMREKEAAEKRAAGGILDKVESFFDTEKSYALTEKELYYWDHFNTKEEYRNYIEQLKAFCTKENVRFEEIDDLDEKIKRFKLKNALEKVLGGEERLTIPELPEFKTELDEIKKYQDLHKCIELEIALNQENKLALPSEVINFLKLLEASNSPKELPLLQNPDFSSYTKEINLLNGEIKKYLRTKDANILNEINAKKAILLDKISKHYLTKMNTSIEKLLKKIKVPEYSDELIEELEAIFAQQRKIASLEEEEIEKITHKEVLLKNKNKILLSRFENSQLEMLLARTQQLKFIETNLHDNIDSFVQLQKFLPLYDTLILAKKVNKSDAEFETLFQQMAQGLNPWSQHILNLLIITHKQLANQELEDEVKNKIIAQRDALIDRIIEEITEKTNLLSNELFAKDYNNITTDNLDNIEANRNLIQMSTTTETLEKHKALCDSLEGVSKLSHEERKKREHFLIKSKNLYESNLDLLWHFLDNARSNALNLGFSDRLILYFKNTLPTYLNTFVSDFEQRFTLQAKQDIALAKKIATEKPLDPDELLIYEKEKAYIGTLYNDYGVKAPTGLVAHVIKKDNEELTQQKYLEAIRFQKKIDLFNLLWDEATFLGMIPNPLGNPTPKTSFTSQDRRKILRTLRLFLNKNPQSLTVEGIDLLPVLRFFENNTLVSNGSPQSIQIQNLLQQSFQKPQGNPELEELIKKAEARVISFPGSENIGEAPEIVGEAIEWISNFLDFYTVDGYKIMDPYTHFATNKNFLHILNTYGNNPFFKAAVEHFLPEYKETINLILEQLPLILELNEKLPATDHPEVSELEDFIDEIRNGETETKTKTHNLKKQKALEKVAKKEEEFNKTKEYVFHTLPANNVPLLEVPLTQDISVGVTPYDVKKLSYDAGKAYLEGIIDNQIDTFKKEEVKKAFLKDHTKILAHLKNISPDLKKKLRKYIKSGRKKHAQEEAIIDNRPTTPVSLLSLFRRIRYGKKPEKIPKKSSTVNKLRNYFDEHLTPILDKPIQKEILLALFEKTLFNTVVRSIESTLIGESTGLQTYHRNGSEFEANAHLVFTPTNTTAWNCLGALISTKFMKLFTLGGAFSKQAYQFAKPEMIKEYLREKTKYVPEEVRMLAQSLISVVSFDTLLTFIPEELLIATSGNVYIFMEYTLSYTLFECANSIVEYILFDKISAQQLSIYLQKNTVVLEEILQEYQRATERKDPAGIAYAERRFEKFLARSKVAPVSNTTIMKQMPKFFMAFNLASRLLFQNGVEGFSKITGLPKWSINGGLLAAVLGLSYSICKPLKTMYNTMNNTNENK